MGDGQCRQGGQCQQAGGAAEGEGVGVPLGEHPDENRADDHAEVGGHLVAGYHRTPTAIGGVTSDCGCGGGAERGPESHQREPAQVGCQRLPALDEQKTAQYQGHAQHQAWLAAPGVHPSASLGQQQCLGQCTDGQTDADPFRRLVEHRQQEQRQDGNPDPVNGKADGEIAGDRGSVRGQA
ncbi:hypothetical protein D3C84_787730 [compost metagenome]